MRVKALYGKATTLLPLLGLSLLAMFISSSLVNVPRALACPGDGPSLFFLHSWTRFFPNCDNGVPTIQNINDVGALAFWGVDSLLKVSAYVALGFIIWGGIKYIKSNGEPASISEAKSTVLQACIGMGIALAATAIVNFVSTRFN